MASATTFLVAPDAEHRILITASEDARLSRRATELHGTAAAEQLAATRDQVVRRDRDDADTGHGALDVRMRRPGRHPGPRAREVVALPEPRPRRENQQQPCFEQVQGEQHATEQGND